MTSRRVYLVVEGQTEETFVKQTLVPPLAARGVFVAPMRITTSRTSLRVHKGGYVTFAHLERDIRRLLKQDAYAHVSSMVDWFRMPTDTPGWGAASAFADPYAAVAALEASLAEHFESARFVPYVQLHEFEALLYTDPAAAQEVTGSAALARTMVDALSKHGDNPELINTTPQGAPSKRIESVFPRYEKVTHGVLIAHRISLQSLRSRCRHFAEWCSKLEGLPALCP